MKWLYYREIIKFENIPLNSKIINDMGYLKDVETPLNFSSKISKIYYQNLINKKKIKRFK